MALQVPPRSLVVAIDFGTHASGFAWAKKPASSGSVRVCLHEGYPGMTDDARYHKTRTALLLQGRRVAAWGQEALTKLASTPLDQQKDYSLLTCFKLGLHDPSKVPTNLPPGLPLEQAITDYLQALRKYALKVIAQELGARHAHPDAIQWCLTVPAQWGEGDKQAMRRVARRAGLVREEDGDGLAVILEPEAAALHALEHRAPPLAQGEHVMVLDAGGGTVDITVHECVTRGGRVVLAEAAHAVGGLCGSAFVDQAFREYYREQVGPAAFDAWAQHYPGQLLQVMDRFEAIKRAFAGGALDAAAAQLANMRIGQQLVRSTGGPCTSSSAAASSSASAASAYSATTHGSYRVPVPSELQAMRARRSPYAAPLHEVTLSSSVLYGLFQGPVQEIISLAQQQLAAARQTSGQRCSKVLLVGGFAASPHLQACLRSALVTPGLAGSLIVPPNPHTAVLSGGVIYGCHPELIHARRARMAYGIRTCVPYVEGAPGRFRHREKDCDYSDAKLRMFVLRNQLVAKDEVVHHTFYPLYSDQTSATFDIYATLDNSTEWVFPDSSDTQEVGSITVEVPPMGDATKRRLLTSMHFGGTEITVMSVDEKTGKSMKTTVRFAQQR